MLKIDLHLHTVASGHGHNTILEYINRAKELKMKIIGFSEHGPSLLGSACETYFRCLDRLPRYVNKILILRGIEANIIDKKGSLDITDKTINDKLDYVIAGLHRNTGIDNLSIKENTKAVINTLKSNKINILAHPFINYKIPIDTKKVCEEACRQNILLEINIQYLLKAKIKPDTLPNLKIMIDVVKKYKKKIIINSDAHNIWELADDSILKKYKKQIGLDDKMIINNYPKELFKMLRIK